MVGWVIYQKKQVEFLINKNRENGFFFFLYRFEKVILGEDKFKNKGEVS